MQKHDNAFQFSEHVSMFRGKGGISKAEREVQTKIRQPPASLSANTIMA